MDLIAHMLLAVITVAFAVVALTGWRRPEVRAFARLVRAFHGAGATWRESLCLPLALPAAFLGQRGATWLNDLGSNVVSGMALKIAAYTSTNAGTAVDMSAAEGNCFAVVLPGTITDGTHTPSVTEADTSGGQYSAITPYQAFAAAASDTPQIKGFKRTKRFIKASDTVSGLATTGGILGVLVLGMKKAV